MKYTVLGLVLLSLSSVTTAATVSGDSSDKNKVNPKASSALPFGAGEAGLSINNSSLSINLAKGPIKYIRQKYAQPINGTNLTANVDGYVNPQYLKLKDINPVIGLFSNPTLGQVWYEKRALNTDVYSIRQIANPIVPAAPKFGGLVIAQVANEKVYFGEWAPRAGKPATGSSTDLNMNSAERTVWYVGENPSKNISSNETAVKYAVLGVNKHTPGKNDFYNGVLTANFKDSKLNGHLARGNDKIDFAGTRITKNDGKFSNKKEISGQFYGNNAAALAGKVDRGAANSVAFGGKRQ